LTTQQADYLLCLLDSSAFSKQETKPLSGYSLAVAPDLRHQDAGVRMRSAQELGQLGAAAGPTFPIVWDAYHVEQDAGTKQELADTLKRIDCKAKKMEI
jgi:hypothetical protein